MTGPLAGLHVLDLTEGDGAPYCAMQLGDAGADVIKVETVEGDWARQLGPPFDHGDGALFMGMNRDKRSIAVDFEMDEGRAIVGALAVQSDVFVQAFPKTGDATRLGLDYESLAVDLPALIYCDISLLERRGPDADKPATDLTVQARAGLPPLPGRAREDRTVPVRVELCRRHGIDVRDAGDSCGDLLEKAQRARAEDRNLVSSGDACDATELLHGA